MAGLMPPSSLNFTGNVAKNWKRFKQRFMVYLEASDGLSKTDSTQTSIFLHIIGEEGLAIYNTLSYDTGDDKKLDVVMQKFETYCTPKRNITYERHRFFTCLPQSDDTIDQYITELRTRAKTCEFGTLCDSLIRDRIVCGIHDNALRERLLRDPKLTLDTAIQTCRASEATKSHVQGLHQTEATNVDVVSKQTHDPKQRSAVYRHDRYQDQGERGNTNTKLCGNCATRHAYGACPAYGKTCNQCRKKNHYARFCRSAAVGKQRINTVEQQGNTSTNQDPMEEFFIDVVNHQGDSVDWIQPLIVNDSEINFKLDTGAQINIIPVSEYDKLLPKPKLYATKVKLTAYGGTPVPVMGQCIAKLHHKSKTQFVSFYVVPRNVQPLMGVETCVKLGLIKRVNRIQAVGLSNTNETSDYDTIRLDDADVFEGLGCLPGEHKIVIDPQASPVAHPCRKVPFALQDDLKRELQRMVELGVITKVEEPTEWVHPLVIVRKKNGDLRVCLDPRSLNKVLSVSISNCLPEKM
ncbi:hypothetical protein BSL78_06220 [Apostichopus japonicus]|uniref:Peptidase A2 domain-containing protein n=1 Tax=Stichopus japonicus TaxID=307972 RepID=A0A2G8L9H5_STIJA|nr:hypothetical protein BSL78_06220 [Apostichopus japonicus]